MISVQNLTKMFGSQAAVDGLSFEIPAGQIVGFLAFGGGAAFEPLPGPVSGSSRHPRRGWQR